MKQSAFLDHGHWYKGNTHTHTTLSDGAYEPERQIEAYKSHGYDFLSFTDHNVMNIHSKWSNGDFLMLPGWERDILYEAKVKCTHVVGLFDADTPDGQVKLPPGDKEKMTDRQMVDEMRSMHNTFISLAHPSWSRMEADEILALDEIDAVECFNFGTECLCHEGHAEWAWDLLLRHGRHVNGMATDDTHSHTERDDHFGGWVMVNAPTLTRKAILENLKAGNYYSTMGPTIKDWGRDGDSFYIECSPVDEIHFITYPKRGKANFGKDLTHMTYPLKGEEKYLRIEIIDKNGCRAYTNPWYF